MRQDSSAFCAATCSRAMVAAHSGSSGNRGEGRRRCVDGIGRNGGGDDRGGGSDPAFQKELPQLFQCATDALFRAVFRGANRGADFVKASPFEITKHDYIAVFFIE